MENRNRPHRANSVLLVLALLVLAADADAVPIQFNITDLGKIPGTGLDNDGHVIAQPVRDIVGTYDPGNPYFVSNILKVVDGTADGRLLINGSGPLDSPYRHTMQTYVYSPATDGIPPIAWQVSGRINDSMGTSGVDMNERGDVVGWIAAAWMGTAGSVRPFYYDSTTRSFHELNDLIPPDSGWELNSALSINDRDQILGEGRNPDGQLVKFLLTPVDQVPEPATWAVFGLATAAFAWRKRRAG